MTNAETALAALELDEAAFDLAFTDVIMPGMNGVYLALAIRQRFPHFPVVLTSGYSEVLAANADLEFDIIQKPYSVESILQSTRREYGVNRRSNLTPYRRPILTPLSDGF